MMRVWLNRFYPSAETQAQIDKLIAERNKAQEHDEL